MIKDAELTERALQMIEKNPSASLYSEEFLEVSLDALCLLLERNPLSLPEIYIFRAVKR